MTLIRVNPSTLRKASADLISISSAASGVGSDIQGSASGAPSYDGQFGPKVQAIAAEATARAQALANSLANLSEELFAKADAFETADLASVQGISAIWSNVHLSGVIPPGFSIEIPTWVWELLIGFLPFGDAYDIIKELKNFIMEGDTDELVLVLAILGLVADLGWINPFPSVEDAPNAALAALKTLVKQIPPGPARDAIADVMKHLVKNADEAPRFFSALFLLLKQDEIFTALGKNHRALAAVLEAGPEVMEQLAKNGDVVLELLKHEDVAVLLFKNNDVLEAVIKGGPEAVEQLFKYGDDVALRYIDEVASTNLASVELLQGLDVSRLSQELGVDIHIAGRWADTPAEVELRRLAAEQVDVLVDKGVPKLEAQLQVADEFGIDFYQARVSSGADEIDAFIPHDQWEALSPGEQESIRNTLANTFEVDPDQVDLYQNIDQIIPEEVGLPADVYDIPDPKTNVPPGSIHFSPDGAIEHPSLGYLEIMNKILENLWP